MLTIKFDARKFFEPSKITKRMNRVKKRSMMKIGAYIRQRARSSIKKRKRISRPGQPPSSHTGLLRKIFFQYEKETDSVMIGPRAFRTPKIPESLELGGRSKVGRARRVVRVKARPFMRPALEKEMKNRRLMNAWANVL